MGLVIEAISEVCGADSHDWPTELRHVRQVSQFATAANLSSPKTGSLVVFKQVYTSHSGPQIDMPRHIGINIDTDPNTGVHRFIHSKYGTGQIVESSWCEDPRSEREPFGIVDPGHLAGVAFISLGEIMSDWDNPHVQISTR